MRKIFSAIKRWWDDHFPVDPGSIHDDLYDHR